MSGKFVSADGITTFIALVGEYPLQSQDKHSRSVGVFEGDEPRVVLYAVKVRFGDGDFVFVSEPDEIFDEIALHEVIEGTTQAVVE